VHAAADGFHHHGRHQIARHSGKWLDLEEQYEDRRHQCAAAHAGQADSESDDEARKGDVRIDVHR
jgi:hypothetical protein